MTETKPDIHKLPEEIVRLIAAGEVVERPSSVVKELVENSLDAGACHIEVKLENGGKDAIVVRDDGFGIPSEQVPLLMERHTTSKISHEADLNSIITLGFRGEALYSVAAASDVIISTRFRDEEAGTRLSWQAGERKIETISWPGGTQVESLRLFHSIPARKKFLRSESAEYSRVASLVSSYALAYPAIAWRLIHNGRESIRTPGTGNLDDAMLAVYGTDTARKMLRVNYRREGVRVTGSVSSLEIHRARRTDQYIFLNGRLIKDPGIMSALERPYMQFLPAGRHPLTILKIECDPGEVDVNVHPHKREVRLANPRHITGAVYRAVEETLMKHHPIQGAQPVPDGEAGIIDADVSIDEKTGEVFPGAPPVAAESTGHARQITSDEREWAIRGPKSRHTSDWPATSASGGKGSRRDEALHVYPSFDDIGIDFELPTEGNTIQFADTYIIYNQGRAIYLIDQHNLHERILFEEFMNREDASGIVSQALLFPVQVKLPPSLENLVQEHMDDLNSLGFEIEEFGERGTFVLRSVPQALKKADPVQAFTDVLEKASENEGIDDKDGFRRAFIINLSCKSAIKAGQKLTEEEIDYLIKHIGDGTYFTCPHGRPTIVRLDEDWFRRAFKRSQ